METLWATLLEHQSQTFYTARGLEFTYTIRGGEMFVSRKEKSITRASVELAYKRAAAMGGVVSGPKKLGVFGASYLYPIFIGIGVIKSAAAVHALEK